MEQDLDKIDKTGVYEVKCEIPKVVHFGFDNFCFGRMRDLGLASLNDGCQGLINTKSGFLQPACVPCLHLDKNKPQNLLGEVKKNG